MPLSKLTSNSISTSETVQTLSTNSVERLRIDANGNIGIGTSNALAKLTVANTGIAGGAPLATGNTADGNSAMRLTMGSVSLDTGIYSNGITWTQPRATANYAVNYGMSFVPNGGNIGIGTGSPQSKVHIYNPSYASFTGTSLGPVIITDSTSTLNNFTSIDFNTINNNALPLARVGMQYTSSGSWLAFGTSNNYASGTTSIGMAIDPNGRVIMPYQPAFYATGTGTVVLTASANTMVFIYGVTNVGGNYNISNGRFTAPIAGTYKFTWSLTQTSTTGGPVAYLYKNGALVGSGAIAYGVGYNQGFGQAMYTLAAGDYVTIGAYALNGTSPTVDLSWMTFTGHLIG